MKPPKSRKNSDLSFRSSAIKAEARRLGFTGCGISKIIRLQKDAVLLRKWLDNHHHGDMAYMEKHFDKRVDPAKLREGVKSVISVLLNYYTPQFQADPDAPVISKYAYGEDYHKVVKRKLTSLLKFINAEIAPAKGFAFVDSAPVLDRAWAARAGLGWIGKNSNLISPQTGSFVFIGSLMVDLELACDQPIRDLCGTCDRCMSACPTSAIIAPRTIDARRCISYLTIENKTDIDPVFRDSFQNRVFGCDICQDVCPWNLNKATAHGVTEFNPLPGLLEMDRKAWYEMDEQHFVTLFARSTVKRTKYSGFKRNIRFIENTLNIPPKS